MPDERSPIDHALVVHGIDPETRSERPLGGGHGQSVTKIALSDGSSLVAKSVASHERDRIGAEWDGLAALCGSEHIHAPRVWDPVEHAGRVVMLMDWLEPVRADDDTWARFGAALAAHHNTQASDTYGWTRDNFLGAMPQVNTPSTDWVEFNRAHRLGFQLELTIERRVLASRDVRDVRRVIDTLDAFIPSDPVPSLLHGDLWGGNALAASIDGVHTIALIDPAVHAGDGWADIAMMKLFGGFPDSCFDAYTRARGDKDRIEPRILVYQLYHVLNHANLFGGSYGTQSGVLARQLLAM